MCCCQEKSMPLRVSHHTTPVLFLSYLFTYSEISGTRVSPLAIPYPPAWRAVSRPCRQQGLGIRVDPWSHSVLRSHKPSSTRHHCRQHHCHYRCRRHQRRSRSLRAAAWQTAILADPQQCQRWVNGLLDSCYGLTNHGSLSSSLIYHFLTSVAKYFNTVCI